MQTPFKIGQELTYIGERFEGSYSNYGITPKFFLEPGTRVSVTHVNVPYVRHIRGNSQTFLNVTFFSPATGRMERAHLDERRALKVLTERSPDLFDDLGSEVGGAALANP